MPRSNWKGSIAFGLVNIPIVLFPATNKSADIAFHQIDRRDQARIKYQRINAQTGKVVPWEEISRGYEYDKDTTIPVPDEVLKKVAGDNGRSIEIETFVDKKELDLTTLANAYFIVPEKKGEKGYVILREALEDANKVGIAKVIISTKEYIAAVIPYENALKLCLLKYDNEVKKPPDFDLPKKDLAAYKISKKEIDIAKKLIQSMSSKWQAKKYIDEYQKAVHQWVEESVNDLPHPKVKKRVQAKSSNVDFIDLLRKSLATTKTKKPRKSIKPTVIKKTNKSINRHATKH